MNMADFRKSYERLKVYEGLYIDDPDDRGGETYRGIPRKFHPDWQGWAIIDQAKKGGSFYDILTNDENLKELTMNFFYDNVWTIIKGGRIDDQMTADEIFEMSVNLGIETAVRILQRSINLLNRNQSLYYDITVDGIAGNETIKTLKVCLYNNPKLLFNLLNFYQAMVYIDLMEKNRNYEIFTGWFNRIEILK